MNILLNSERAESKYCRVDDVEGEEEDGCPEGEVVPGVRLNDGETSDHADTAVDHHAETTEERRSKSIPITT